MRKDPTDWRNGFRQWKETGKLPWKAGKRLPKFEGGNESVIVGDYNVYPSAIGASELNVTTPEVVVTGKDRRPAYQKYDAYNSTNYNYIKTLAKNVAHKSGGKYDISGLLNGLVGVMRGMDKPYKGDYNGTITWGNLYSNLKPADKRSVIDMLFSDNDGGFLKYKGNPIIVNGKQLGDLNNYYSYPILPIDTLRFPNYARNTIDSLSKTKNIYAFNLDPAPTEVEDLIKNKEWTKPILDVQNASMSIQPGYLKIFDQWDNGGGMLGDIYNRFARRPIFVHDVPYTFGNYSNRDLKILRNVANTRYENVHDDMREFNLQKTIDALIEQDKKSKTYWWGE